MLTFLLKRPIAVCTVFLTILVLGVLSFFKLPTSLMPAVEVPGLRISVSYPKGNPRYIEQNVLQPIRTAISSVYGLEEIESVSSTGVGQIDVKLTYESDPQLAYLEVNEKIDEIQNIFPEDLKRPIVQQINPTDIPVVRVQITSKEVGALELTDLSQLVVKRRLEQLKGVSLVESNGTVNKVIRLTPNDQKMEALGLSIQDLIQTLRAANVSLNQIHVKDGIYAYNITFNNLLEEPDQLKKIRISKGLNSVALHEICNIETTHGRRSGMHFFNNEEGIVLAVHLQPTARMTSVLDEMSKTLSGLSLAHPEVSFSTSQNQNSLLSSTLYQLLLSLAIGSVVAVIILFLFSGEMKSPILMAALIPISIALTLFFMMTLGLTLNLITLSGLILGLGILVDNGIILLDNISTKVKGVVTMQECVQGTREVVTPMISSLLTTLCVFIPLLFLGGLSSALFIEQIITLSIVLAASLVVSFILLPVLYHIIKPRKVRSHGSFFDGILKRYEKSKLYQSRVFLLLGIITVLGVVSFFLLPKQNLPEIKTTDAEVLVYWSEPLSIDRNIEIVSDLLMEIQPKKSEAEIGETALRENEVNLLNQSRLYLQFSSVEEKEAALNLLNDKVSKIDPHAIIDTRRAKNPYDQLFAESESFAKIKLRTNNESLLKPESTRELHLGGDLGYGFQQQPALFLSLKQDQMDLYNISQQSLIDRVERHLDDQIVTSVDKLNEVIPITISGDQSIAGLSNLRITVNDSLSVPLLQFVDLKIETEAKFFTADQVGPYQALEFEEQPHNWSSLLADIQLEAKNNNLLLSLDGWVIDRTKNYLELGISILLAITLLFIILVAQFESIKAPLAVLSEIPVAIAGSLLLLWVCGQGLNISSLMGIIIALGIIVNDSILKLDSIIRYTKSGLSKKEAIAQAGRDRLKPILMTSITTIVALIPVLFTTGFGGGLQKPMVVAVIGGLLVGTLCSIYLMPRVYDRLAKG